MSPLLIILIAYLLNGFGIWLMLRLASKADDDLKHCCFHMFAWPLTMFLSLVALVIDKW